jgi:hypothetical protein
VASTDGHSKSYGLLIGAGGQVRLAPLCDLASILPYTDMNLLKAKLAMKIGGEYLLGSIGLYRWEKMAAELRLESEALIQRVDGFPRQLPELAENIRRQLNQEGIKHNMLDKLTQTITRRSMNRRKRQATASERTLRNRRRRFSNLRPILGVSCSRSLRMPACGQHGVLSVKKTAWYGRIQTAKAVGSENTIPIAGNLAEMLRKFIGDRRTGLLFANRAGRPYFFETGIVVGVGRPTHARNHVVLLEDGYIFRASVLQSSIRVMHEAGLRLSAPDGLLQHSNAPTVRLHFNASN